MMHVLFTQMQQANLPVPQPGPMKPAEYLRLRRAAARLSIEQAAERIAPRIRDRSEAVALIKMLETDGVRARHETTIDVLLSAFLFDPMVYRQLCEEPADRHPAICRGCGCSEQDPCVRHGGLCEWVSPDQCSHCASESFAACQPGNRLS